MEVADFTRLASPSRSGCGRRGHGPCYCELPRQGHAGTWPKRLSAGVLWPGGLLKTLECRLGGHRCHRSGQLSSLSETTDVIKRCGVLSRAVPWKSSTASGRCLAFVDRDQVRCHETAEAEKGQKRSLAHVVRITRLV